jgi:hypothetical protein
MAFLKTLLWEKGLSSWWKPKIFWSSDDDACATFPSWSHQFFWESGVHVLSWWWMYCCCYGWNTVAGILFLSFFWLGASVLLLGYCVVEEIECNLSLLDINRCPLSKKPCHHGLFSSRRFSASISSARRQYHHLILSIIHSNTMKPRLIYWKQAVDSNERLKASNSRSGGSKWCPCIHFQKGFQHVGRD